MSTESSGDDRSDRLVVGVAGTRSVEEVRFLLDQLDPDVTVTRFEVEFAADDAVGLSLPGGVRVDAAGGDGDGRTPGGARLQVDSVPFHIVALLDDRDEPMRTAEITEALDDVDLSQNEISSRLWNLANRGLVHKRAYEADRRQKVYSVSDVGVAALEAARDRSA